MPWTRNSKDEDAPANPRGIPKAPFVDKVEDYVSSRAEVEPTLRSFQEMISWVSPWPPNRTGPRGANARQDGGETGRG